MLNACWLLSQFLGCCFFLYDVCGVLPGFLLGVCLLGFVWGLVPLWDLDCFFVFVGFWESLMNIMDFKLLGFAG